MVRYLIAATLLAPLLLSGCMSSARRLMHADGGFFTKPYAATTADALVAIGVPVTHSDDPKQEATPVSPILRTAAAVDTPFTFAADTALLPGDAIATAPEPAITGTPITNAHTKRSVQSLIGFFGHPAFVQLDLHDTSILLMMPPASLSEKG